MFVLLLHFSPWRRDSFHAYPACEGFRIPATGTTEKNGIAHSLEMVTTTLAPRPTDHLDRYLNKQLVTHKSKACFSRQNTGLSPVRAARTKSPKVLPPKNSFCPESFILGSQELQWLPRSMILNYSERPIFFQPRSAAFQKLTLDCTHCHSGDTMQPSTTTLETARPAIYKGKFSDTIRLTFKGNSPF